ncbi:hypothetical protein RsTz2092_01550 [Deferribacterales bacterium RsTz2092]|nr:hypothetical protein AGMMS49941_04690 [Deferribacterales bacterium]
MLFSNDSDMTYSVQISTEICKKHVGLYIDKKATTTKILQKYASYTKRISQTMLATNQLPATIKTSFSHTITKPKNW